MSRRSLARRTHNAWFITLGSLAAVAVLLALLLWNPERDTVASTGQPILVYCAAGLKVPAEAIKREYAKAYGIEVELDFGNSEGLLNKMELARRGDLYLPADTSYLDKARAKGLLAETIPAATMKPILAVRRGNPRQIQGLADLMRPEVKIGLANPDLAAVSALVRKALPDQWLQLQKKALVIKPTVTDVANDIKLRAVDAGFIWDAMLVQYPELEAVPLPALESATAEIAIGVLTSSRQPTAALRFARYLTARDKGLEFFRQQGYRPVDGDDWAETPRIVLFSGAMLRTAIEDTLNHFQKREGVEIDWVQNGCGILLGQMSNPKTRCDAYFACDLPFMLKPVARERFPDSVMISENEVVILVDKGNPKEIKGLKDLLRPGLRIGVAHPEKSALGALTERLFEEAGLLEAFRASKNTVVESASADALVSQIRLSRHSLDAVVVFRSSTAYVRDELDVVELNSPSARALQPFAISKDSRHKQLLGRLLQAIRSRPSQERFEALGFRWRAE